MSAAVYGTKLMVPHKCDSKHSPSQRKNASGGYQQKKVHTQVNSLLITIMLCMHRSSYRGVSLWHDHVNFVDFEYDEHFISSLFKF